MELHVVRHLRTKCREMRSETYQSNTPEDFTNEAPEVLKRLRESHGIRFSHHKRFPNLVLLKYAQIKAKFASPLVQESRGLILDVKANFKVVSFPFLKFFNLGEPNAAEITWVRQNHGQKSADAILASSLTGTRVYEKLDGSLAVLYFYRGEWHVSSSGVPDASAKLHSCDRTFAELFWSVWKTSNDGRNRLPPVDDDCGRCSLNQQPNEIDWTKFCFMFEMLTHENIIIVRPDRERVVLTGVRNLETYQELDPGPVAEHLGWDCVETFPLNSVDSVLSAARRLDPVKAEGFVVCDELWNRVKIKAPQYVALSHLAITNDSGSAATARNLLNIARHDEGGEFLTYFPFYRVQYEYITKRLAHAQRRLAANVSLIRRHFASTRSDTSASSECTNLAPQECSSRSPHSESDDDFGDTLDEDGVQKSADRSLDTWQPLDDTAVTAKLVDESILDQLKLRSPASRPLLLRLLQRVRQQPDNDNDNDTGAQDEEMVVDETMTMSLFELHAIVEAEKKFMPVSSSSSDDDQFRAPSRRDATRRQKRQLKKSTKQNFAQSSAAPTEHQPLPTQLPKHCENIGRTARASPQARVRIPPKPTKVKKPPIQEEKVDELLKEFAERDAENSTASKATEKALAGGVKSRKKRKPRKIR